MEDIDIALIKKRSLTGVVALTSRTFLLQVIAFVATFLLTIFLSPQIFGVFYVVSAIISFLGYFADIGLAAALIQKKEELTREDLSTTFTIQQILVGSGVVLAMVFSSAVADFYHLDSSGLWLLRALVVSFFLSSLKTIPSILLERKLAFNKLIIPQILETLGFYIVAVWLAWGGYGIVSFTWAVLTRAVIGLVAMYIVSPWRISLRLSADVAKKLMKFGVPFQLNGFIALLKDDLLTVFLGKILPFAEVGYIGWAKKWAEVPLRLIMDSVIRVTFPAFSRLQASREHLRAAIEKTLFGLSATIFPISVGLLFFVQPLIGIIPKYGKWEPAIASFYLLTVTAIFAGLTTPLTNALNAIGKIRVTLGLMVMWTVLTWALTLAFVQLFGFNGVAMAFLAVSTTIVIVVQLVKREVQFSFSKSVLASAIAATAQGALYFGVLRVVPHSLVWLILAGVSGVILYAGLLWMLEKKRITDTIASFRS
ncbi:MAG: Polysaccharide biosynthesis protein [Microgenomates group bacterium GW2011_GWC1_49_7]|nr:MAG: Polysaccharide biosynthesis protein [Microgenomates group bacterium GW2011_GWC1_49_7]